MHCVIQSVIQLLIQSVIQSNLPIIPFCPKSVIFLQDITFLEMLHNNYIKLTGVKPVPFWNKMQHCYIEDLAKSVFPIIPKAKPTPAGEWVIANCEFTTLLRCRASIIHQVASVSLGYSVVTCFLPAERLALGSLVRRPVELVA